MTAPHVGETNAYNEGACDGRVAATGLKVNGHYVAPGMGIKDGVNECPAGLVVDGKAV